VRHARFLDGDVPLVAHHRPVPVIAMLDDAAAEDQGLDRADAAGHGRAGEAADGSGVLLGFRMCRVALSGEFGLQRQMRLVSGVGEGDTTHEK
jgi:hypothetical protein